MSLPPTIRRVALIGFMGAGKSTVGALLAQTLNWQFVDTDAFIESRAGRSVAQIFAQDGEHAFRAMEADAIRRHANSAGLVLALGGGAIEHDLTCGILHRLRETRIVFLDAPLEVMVARCMAQPQAAVRPILADRERLIERFSNRMPQYRRAHLTIATANLAPLEVVEAIVAGLSQPRITESASIAALSDEKGLPTR